LKGVAAKISKNELGQRETAGNRLRQSCRRERIATKLVTKRKGGNRRGSKPSFPSRKERTSHETVVPIRWKVEKKKAVDPTRKRGILPNKVKGRQGGPNELLLTVALAKKKIPQTEETRKNIHS